MLEAELTEDRLETELEDRLLTELNEDWLEIELEDMLEAELWLDIEDWLETCLLYTSPSPRDS